jgi:hypothetical protein
VWFSYELANWLEPSEAIARELLSASRVIFGSLVLVVVSFSSIRGMVFRRAADPLRSVVLVLFVGLVLEEYTELFHLIVEAGDTLHAYIREQTGVLDFWGRFLHSVQELWTTGHYLDAVQGTMKGFGLALASLGSYGFAWACSRIVLLFAAVYLNILYILGPLWVMMGVVGQGEHLRAYFGSVIRTLLWPIYPCIVMLIVSHIGTDANVAKDNLVMTYIVNGVLGLSSVLSPWIVGRLVRQGPGAIGSVAFSVGVGVAARLITGAVMGGGGALAMGAGGAGALTSQALPNVARNSTSTSVMDSPPISPPPTADEGHGEPAVLYDQPGAPIIRSEQSHQYGRDMLAKIRDDLERL